MKETISSRKNLRGKEFTTIFTRRTFLHSALLLPPLFGASASAQDRNSVTFADFEGGTWGDWTTEGQAFGTTPATDTLFPGKIFGFGGHGFVCTLHPRKGNAAVGRAVSREFTIEKPFISFKIGGGNFPGQACLNLIVEGRIVRTETGNGSSQLLVRSWDVSEFAGKTAHFEIIDSTQSESRGYILVDEIAFEEKRNTEFQQWMDETANTFLQRNGYPGVWVSTFYQGRELGSVAAGYADVETKKSASLSDVIWMGSVSKTVLATIFAKAVEAGQVSYDSTLGEIPGVERLPLSVQKITARELIAHTSGLPRDTNFRASSGDTNFTELRKKAMLTFLATGIDASKKETYSNIGYTALAVLLESKTGHAFEKWVYDLMVVEQGLPSFSSGAKRDAPTAYRLTANDCVKARGDMGTYEWAASGSVRSSIRDLCRFGLIHCGEKFARKSFFSDDRFLFGLHKTCPNSAHTLAAFWVEPHTDGGYVLTHSGLLLGARGDSTLMYIEPKSGLVIAAYTNCGIATELGEQYKRPTAIEQLQKELVNPIYHRIKRT